MALQVTAAAHPNLAFVKYWGNTDAALNIPANGSISVNLDGATTTTTVVFSASRQSDAVAIDGRAAEPATCERVVRHLDRVRRLAGSERRAVVESFNDFPAAAGIASSASAFAALSLAASRAAGLELDERQLSALARQGSGSACRSIPHGFVEWQAGDSDATSFARQIAPPEHWNLRITTVILDEKAKEVSSWAGHRAAPTSPFYQARLAGLPATLAAVRQGLLDRDIHAFGLAAEREAISMHAVCMTSRLVDRPWLGGIYYWQPGTMAVIQAVQAWRRGGLAVYFTIDAGQNVHLIAEGRTQPALEAALERLLAEIGGRYLVSGPGRGAWVVEERRI
ncbi:MAG: diphosphomevalonate decarboxylase [Chloroflexota bacterium]